jgi:hypothetical protein
MRAIIHIQKARETNAYISTSGVSNARGDALSTSFVPGPKKLISAKNKNGQRAREKVPATSINRIADVEKNFPVAKNTNTTQLHPINGSARKCQAG